MNRRNFVYASSTTFTLLAGCSGLSDENDIRDSDGDGVIDSEDYAPQDSEVQEKSDIAGNGTITRTPDEQDATETQTSASTPTPTPEPTATSTPTATPTPDPTATSTPTPTPTPDRNSIQVDREYWAGGSQILEYSSGGVTVAVQAGYPTSTPSSVRVYAQLLEYPRAERVAESLSDTLERTDNRQNVTIDFSGTRLDESTKYHYYVALVPANKSLDEISAEDMTTIMESDAFELASGGPNIERASYPGALSDDSGDSYTRQAVEGAYDLSVSGRTNGQEWTVNFFAWKSAHAEGASRSRGRAYDEYVSFELASGSAPGLAELLNEDAETLGFSGRMKVEFVIDFVQSLPYVPDDVSTGYDQYTKFIIETLPEMGGDCEDTAIMLASILSAEPFGYDMILIQPPGHMAAGIWTQDSSGYYWEVDGRKYSYIETTGAGWGIGDLPSEYEGREAYTYQV